MHTNGQEEKVDTQLFHGKFIASQKLSLPSAAARLPIIVALAAIIIFLFMGSSQMLTSWGSWVCPVILTTFCVTSIAVFVVDEVRHPSIQVEDKAP